MRQTAGRLDPPRVWLGNSDAIALVWTVGSLVCLGLALCMHVGDGRKVYFLDWSTALPETCWAHAQLGIDCPGCGLTRTFVHLIHGQWREAWRLSPAGWLVFAFTCAQVPMGLAQIVLRRRDRFVEMWGMWNDWISAGLVVVLLLQWVFKLTRSFFL